MRTTGLQKGLASIRRKPLARFASFALALLALLLAACGDGQAPAQTAEFDAAAYDPGCADRTLGMETTNDIFYDGRPPTSAELTALEPCLRAAPAATELTVVTTTPTEPASRTLEGTVGEAAATFDPDAYDFQCADGILGMEITDQLFPEICGDGCRLPTANELAAIELCLTEASGAAAVEDTGPPASTETESEPTTARVPMFDPDAYDMGCVDGILGMETTDQLFHDGRAPTDEELAMLERCLVLDMANASVASLVPDMANASVASKVLTIPEASLISLAHNTETARTAVRAQAGAVPPNAMVLVGNLNLNDYTLAQADEQGAFEADVAGFPGTYVLIKQDVSGIFIPFDGEWLDGYDHNGIGPRNGMRDMILPGILVRIPHEGLSDGIPFSAAALLESGIQGDQVGVTSAPWTINGAYDRARFEPGETLGIEGQVAILGNSKVQPPTARLSFHGILLGDVNGRQVGRSGRFVSAFVTPTGLPIERQLALRMQHDGREDNFTLGSASINWEWDGQKWVSDFHATLQMPQAYREGHYELVAQFNVGGIEPSADLRHWLYVVDNPYHFATLGVLRVGDPAAMRLTTTLLADEVSEGSRGGLLAREDEGLFDIATRNTTRHQPVLPRLDSHGGSWTYHLEPYAPMLGVVDRGVPVTPPIPLDFSTSLLEVRIERPDGQSELLGPAPLTRYAVKSPRTPWHTPLTFGGGAPREIPQLRGDGDTFAYQFPQDGDYVLRVAGYIHDTGGRRYEISGTYDLTVAHVLDIETSLLPTTPFEVGDSIAPTVTTLPGVPADITYNITHVTADGATSRTAFDGTANSHGWWDGDGEVFTFEHDGEYLIEIEAKYSAPSGDVWAGRVRFGNVVATPDTPMITHGRRGFQKQEGPIPPPWSFVGADLLEHLVAPAQMHYPYFNGDILWGQQDMEKIEAGEFLAGDAVNVRASIQLLDNNHPLLLQAWQQLSEYNARDHTQDITVADLLNAGQMPLNTAPDPASGRPGGHPDEINLWAYMYGSAERPGVRVREVILGDDVVGTYWSVDDEFHMQSGIGRAGDLPGEFKFFYAGAVVRDVITREGVYSIYGSGWVHARDDDPLGVRFTPPFQGASGGPTGGPLFTIHGRETDMFIVPLGVRPGAMLEVGDTFRMAGPIMPCLPSRVEYTVTAPDGKERNFDGRANAIGYFYDPADDFVVDQPGLWTVDLTLTHDGMTSSGPVEPPYPTGGPLTPDGATFTFVVTDGGAQDLAISTDLSQVAPADWFTREVKTADFVAELPADWKANSAHVTVTMPSIVLVDETVALSDNLISWRMDPAALNELANNFDYGDPSDLQPGSFPYAARETGLGDTVILTFFSTSEDGRQAAGTIVTHGARVPPTPD